MLPAADPLVGGEAVLHEVEGPTGLEDPPDLPQGGGDVGNGAQRPGGQGGVAAVVGEGQRLAVQARPPDGHRRRRQALAGQLPTGVGRFDGGHAADRLRVEGDVEPRAETDLDHLPVEAFADPAAQGLERLHAAGDVDDAGQHVFVVDPHRAFLSAVRSWMADRRP